MDIDNIDPYIDAAREDDENRLLYKAAYWLQSTTTDSEFTGEERG